MGDAWSHKIITKGTIKRYLPSLFLVLQETLSHTSAWPQLQNLYSYQRRADPPEVLNFLFQEDLPPLLFTLKESQES